MINREVLQSIKVEGGIFPNVMIDTVRSGKAKWSADADYNVPKGLRLRDEIARAYRMAAALWQDYCAVKNRSDDQQQFTMWHDKLLAVILGYEDMVPVEPQILDDRIFSVNRMACAGTVPVLCIGPENEFDKSEPQFGDNGRRRSPSALMQEYLNAMDTAVYGFVCNGMFLRVYRDNHSLTRPAWLEIDFAMMFTEELYADFALMYQLLHASRLTPVANGALSSILEQWRDEALGTGERVVEKLRIGVTSALETLGNGFLAHKDNALLRDSIETGKLDIKGYQLQLLRLVYRIIFLSTTEERGLLLDPQSPPDIQERYHKGYSCAVLREKARKRLRQDDYSDCWQQLKIVFTSLAHGQKELALPALGGLFASDQCPDIDSSSISNQALLTALHHLSFFKLGATLTRINYRDMDSEELGSVYESLLELVPQIQFENRPWRFVYAGSDDLSKGNARKLTGSYYTPDSLVKELIKSALDPVIKNALDKQASDTVNALLFIKVIDPACGSGHFLLAAARRIAGEYAVRSAAPDQPTDKQYRHALREVISHCIYGVDLNPMAIELARTALWLEAIEPGKPLSFLDAHIRCGNALVGVLDPAVVDRGIPDEAFKPLSGDDKSVCTVLKKENKSHREMLELKSEKVIATDLFETVVEEVLPEFDLSDMPEDTLDDINRKEQKYREFLDSNARQKMRLKEDLYIAAFYINKTANLQSVIPTSGNILKIRGGLALSQDSAKLVRDTADRFRFFHWHLEFPEVFKKGGFDCVLGNPPWERIKLQEEEFFASRSPLVAEAKNKAERAQRIAWLAEGMLAKNCFPSRDYAPGVSDAEKKIYLEFNNARREAEAASLFAHVGKDEGGRFPFTGVGDVNLYALFAELFSQIVNNSGRAGVIVPSGIATDDSTKAFFAYISQNEKLVSLIDFENRDAMFKGVHRSYKFCCLTIGKCKEARFSFFLTNTSQMQDNRRQFTLSGADIALLNPNTRTCPIFRSQYDAELTKKIYRASTVLIDENREDGNPWGISFARLFDMSTDSHLFKTRNQLESMGGELQGAVFSCGSDQYLPLYEAKMVHQYDHRWATYGANGEDTRDMTTEEKRDPNAVALPRYWVHQKHIDDALLSKKWLMKWLLGWRDITNATNERTVIAGIIPISAVGDTFLLMFPNQTIEILPCLLADQCSIVHDYVTRQKIGGVHLKYHYKKQIVNLPPSKYNDTDIHFITSRVLELTFTSHDLTSFAHDLGYDGEPFTFNIDRRAQLRAELDAYYAKLYGLNRDELRYILDPSDLFGEDYPSETFRVLKDKEMREFGEYRTRRLVLEAWDRLEHGELE